MKVLKYIINLLLSFILVFIILFGTFFHICKTKIFNIEYVKESLEKNNFYQNVLEEVNSGFENFIYQSGLPENTIENLASIDIIKNDVNNILSHIMENKELSLSKSVIRNELDIRINKFLDEEKRTLTKKERENIIKFEELIENSYEESILPIKDFLSDLNTYYNKGFEIYNKTKIIPVICFIVTLLLIFVVNKNQKLIIINVIGISILSSGVLIKLLVNVVMKYIDIDNIVAFTNSLTNVLQIVYKDILFGIENTGISYIIIGICMIIFYSIIYGTNVSENVKKH